MPDDEVLKAVFWMELTSRLAWLFASSGETLRGTITFGRVSVLEDGFPIVRSSPAKAFLRAVGILHRHWAEDKLIFSEGVPGLVFLVGIRVPPPGISNMLKFHLKNSQYKMTLAVERRITVSLCQNASVSVLVRRKDSNKVSCIVSRSYFDYIDRTAYMALAFDYLDFSPMYPFISDIRSWVSLLFMDYGNEGIVDAFVVEMEFCDAANSEEEVLWLLDMLDWK